MSSARRRRSAVVLPGARTGAGTSSSGDAIGRRRITTRSFRPARAQAASIQRALLVGHGHHVVDQADRPASASCGSASDWARTGARSRRCTCARRTRSACRFIARAEALRNGSFDHDGVKWIITASSGIAGGSGRSALTTVLHDLELRSQLRDLARHQSAGNAAHIRDVIEQIVQWLSCGRPHLLNAANVGRDRRARSRRARRRSGSPTRRKRSGRSASRSRAC